MRHWTILILLLGTSIATAQEAQLAEAQKISDQAESLYDDQKFDEALVLAKQAYALRKKLLGEEHQKTAHSLNILGFISAGKEDFPAAQAYYDRALAIRRKVLGPEHGDTAETLNDLGSLNASQNKFAEARRFYDEALRIRRKTLGNEHKDTGSSLNDLGELLQAQGEYAAAQPYFDEALKIFEKHHGEEHAETATIMHHAGYNLHLQSKYGEARVLYEQALKIRRKVLGDEHFHTAISLNNLALLFEQQGDIAAARSGFEQSLKIVEKTLGSEHPFATALLTNLASLQIHEGDYAGARAKYEQVLKYWLQRPNSDGVQLAKAYNNLAGAISSQGDFATAKSHYEKALRICLDVLGPEHPQTILTIGDLGLLARQSGDVAGARKLYEEALVVSQKKLGEEHERTITLRNNLGELLRDNSDYAAARVHLEWALQASRKVHGEKNPFTAFVLNNLGNLSKMQGDFAAAKSAFEQSLAIQMNTLGETNLDTAITLDSLGSLAADRRDFDVARASYERSLQIRSKLLGAEHLTTTASLNRLGFLLNIQGDYSGALKYLNQAYRLRQKLLGDLHPETAITLNNIAFSLQGQQKWEEARSHYSKVWQTVQKTSQTEHPQALGFLNNLALLDARRGDWNDASREMGIVMRGLQRHVSRTLPSLSAKEQLTFLQTNWEANFSYALSLARARQDDFDQLSTYAGWLLNGKGIAQEALATQALLSRDSRNPKLAETVTHLKAIRRQLATLAMENTVAGKEAQHQMRMEKLTADEQRLSRELFVASGQLPRSAEWVETDAVRQAIPPDAQLVDIARFKPIAFEGNFTSQPARYFAWVIPPMGSGRIQVVDLGLADPLEKAIEEVRRLFATAGATNSPIRSDGESAAEKQAREALARVAELVWRPIADKMGEKKQLILSPDGALWLLPWAALPVSSEQCLLEKYSLRYVISGRELVRPVVAQGESKTSVIFADPEFNLTADQSQAATKAVLPDYVINNDGALRSADSKSLIANIPRLPNTALEAQAITPNLQRLTDAAPLNYLERYALESIVKRVDRPRIMMFATHGFFLPDQETKEDALQKIAAETRSASLLSSDGKPLENPLLRCGLLLAGCNQPQPSADDGVLTGLEIVNLDLRGTQLVVLSACETGIGKVRNGEGVAGLRQAFQLAGAQSVVSTLWQVPDRDSALIMSDFFTNLAEGQTKADALRNAQLKRIAARRDRNGAAHPFFWAAWTLTGN